MTPTTPPRLRVIVTRPEPQASAWVEALLARGVDAVGLPMLAISPPADAGSVAAAWQRLATHTLVVFVSPNAVRLFFAAAGKPAAWPATALAGSTGPGTSAALYRHGVPIACIVEPAADAAQFDSESLWRALEPRAPMGARGWHGASVLLVRGERGRDWLADRLAAVGASVEAIAAYQRSAPAPTTAGRRILVDALAKPRQHLWLFSSSAGIDHLAALAGDADWRDASALASHPRIAERARVLGVGRVIDVRPGLDAAIACIQSMAP